MNNPIQVLIEEHEKIKQVIEKVKALGDMFETSPNEFRQTVSGMLHFFKTYADQYHHIKEEQILFPVVAQENQIVGESLAEELTEHHEDFREITGRIGDELANNRLREANDLLLDYTDKLLDHIAVEDEEFFIMAESLLSENVLEKMFFDFEDSDRALGTDQKAELEKLASGEADFTG